MDRQRKTAAEKYRLEAEGKKKQREAEEAKAAGAKREKEAMTKVHPPPAERWMRGCGGGHRRNALNR